MFKIGDKVVCKNIENQPKFNSTPTGLIKGKFYTVISINSCKSCGSETLGLKEVKLITKHCAKCDNYLGSNNQYHSYRFEKLQDNFAENVIKYIIKKVKEDELVCDNLVCV